VLVIVDFLSMYTDFTPSAECESAATPGGGTGMLRHPREEVSALLLLTQPVKESNISVTPILPPL
jgi:hypothetical protein